MSKRHYTPEQMEAARRVWAETKKRCAIPGNCTACGYPNDRTNRKTCSRCTQRVVARAKERVQESFKVLHGEMLEKLEAALRDIWQLRREINALHASFKLMRHSRAYVYQKGHRAGIELGIKRGVKASAKFQERLEAAAREESLGEITRQELATMNHAYDTGD